MERGIWCFIVKKKLPKIMYFDLDGTLFDNSEIVVDAYYSGMIGLGYMTKPRTFISTLNGKSTIETAKALGLKEQDWKNMDEWFWEFFGGYCAEVEDVELIPYTEEVLNHLKKNKVRLGIITSNSSKNADLLLKKAGFRDYFEIIVGKEDITKLKPNPDPILYALNEMNFKNKSNEVWMVGDTIYDVQAAKNANVTSIGIPQNHTFDDVKNLKPDLFFETMKGFYKYIKFL